MEVITYFTLTLLLLLPFFLLRTKRASERLPPGSMGLPMIGHSLSILKAMRANKVEEWLQKRITQYGPISKLSLFGHPSIFLHGRAANKFVYTCDGNMLATKQPPSISRILGEKNLLELPDDDHKRVRAALMSFLKPEVMPLMKTLTFNVICSLIIGIEPGRRRDQLIDFFQEIIMGVLAVPVNFPFTQFRRSLEAREKLKPMLMELIQEKRLALEEQRISPDQDLITTLLSIRNENQSNVMTDEEILDNIAVIMVAGHDTSSILLTFLVKLLAENSSVYATIVHGGLSRDIEYGGYLIPKGWQVIWSQTITHMDENIFPDPSKFDPTRFEQDTPAPAFSFVAFGGGIRICPGYEFTRIETLAMVHYLVTHFTWKLSLKDNSFSRDPMPVFKQGLPIKIEPKKSTD